MKKLTAIITMGVLLGAQVGLMADGTMEQKITPVKAPLVVTETTGQPQYAYDSTGWKTLKAGKVLQPGATVRAADGSTVLLRATHAPTFIKVSSGTQVHLTMEAPSEEQMTVEVVRAVSKPVVLASASAR
jgi:phosphotransferase system HPr-like phosphotransfer protein